MQINENCYIPSIEAADIYSNNNRGRELFLNKKGMLAYSLELMKLREQKGFVESKTRTGNQYSSDMINVKFNYKVKSGEALLENFKEKLKKRKSEIAGINESYDKYIALKQSIMKLETDVDEIENKKLNEKWNGIGLDNLRKDLYTKGFTIIDNKGKAQKYVVYKRSSSKSRNGECLFIKESLHKNMMRWSRMSLPFKEGVGVDLAGLLAYESLVGSAIVDTIQIDPASILLVDDVDSIFKETVNVIKTVDTQLDSVVGEATIENSIWDGQSLICKSLMDSVRLGEKGFILLRNHYFKSAAFSTNIQLFLNDNCPPDIKFDDWYLNDMFGNKILAKDVKLISTPNSLKILKFSDVMDVERDNMNNKEYKKAQKNAIYQHWKKKVIVDGSIFGICKHEKPSKLGVDDNGNPAQVMSYQMLNSLPLSSKEVFDLTEFQRDYITSLKDKNDIYTKYLERTSSKSNANAMYVALYEQNEEIALTPFFKNFKRTKINAYVKKVKSGKVLINAADYLVLIGNPYEMLLHSVNKFDTKNVKSSSLKGNQVYSTLFEFDEEIVGFRNPHSSASNLFLGINTYDKNIEKYFNLSKNIIAANSIDVSLLDRLSGSDFDSDSIFATNNEQLVQIADYCQEKYKVCVNGVAADTTSYVLSNEDMSIIDCTLAKSAKFIGRVVNLGQLGNAIYHELSSVGRHDDAQEVMKKVDVVTVLSGLTIDSAKRMYRINTKLEIRNIEKFLQKYMKKEVVLDEVGKVKKIRLFKPLFLKSIVKTTKVEESNKKKVSKYNAYNTPMDFLPPIIKEVPRGGENFI